MPPVVDGVTTPAVWEEYDEIVLVRPPPSLAAALRAFAPGSSGVAAPKGRALSCKRDIESYGVPPAKLANDEAEYAALLKVQAALSDLVEARLRARLQPPPPSLSYGGSGGVAGPAAAGAALSLPSTATSQTATTMGGIRAWNQWRRVAESVIASVESSVYGQP